MSVRLPIRLAFTAALLPLLVVCESVRSWTPPILQPYRPDVQQGNVVAKEMADQLAAGMTRDQVRFRLGTPALVSVFHQDRWDYVYLLKRDMGSEVQSRRLTVHFKDNRVAGGPSRPGDSRCGQGSARDGQIQAAPRAGNPASGRADPGFV